MLRERWEFEHMGAKLAEAAEVKKRHHVARRKWWEQKKNEVMAKIRETGLSIQESVADQSNRVTQFGPEARARITVDVTLQRDLDECTNKVNNHRTLVESYDGWGQVLRGNADARLKLNHDDYLYFFGQSSSSRAKADANELDDE